MFWHASALAMYAAAADIRRSCYYDSAVYKAHRRKLDEADPHTFDFDEWTRVNRWLRVKDRVLNKELNMSTRLERRREALLRKWQIRMKWTAWIVFGAPIALALLALCWRVAVYLVVS